MSDQGGPVNTTPKGEDGSTDPYAYLRGVLPEPESASYLPPTDDVLDAVPAESDEPTRRSRRQTISRRELRAAPPARRLPGRILALLVFGAAVLVSVIVLVIVNLTGDDEPASGAGSEASTSADGTSGSSQEASDLSGPLYEKLPRTVTGGAVSEDGPSGAVYELQDPGYITNPAVPEKSLESYVGVFSGPDLTTLPTDTEDGEGGEDASSDPDAENAVDVTLIATRWGNAEAALADATAMAAALGTPAAQGVVFPDENLGTYWVFNNDGLVTLIWHDGDLGSFTVISEGEGSALDFYYGLSF